MQAGNNEKVKMKRTFALISVVLLSLLLVSPVLAEEYFSFDKGADGWKVWGKGGWRHSTGLGHDRLGSMVLSCNKGEEVTFYRKFALPPGQYLLSAWLRAFDIQPGKWNRSTWLFYKTGEETIFPVKDLKGTFEWSRVQYSFTVTDKPAEIWFRLRTPGTLWLDDISIKSYRGEPIAFRIEKSTQPFPEGNPIGRGVRCSHCYRWMPEMVHFCLVCGQQLEGSSLQDEEQNRPEERLLMGFEKTNSAIEKTRHPFRKFSDMSVEGQRSAVLNPGEFHNFSIIDQTMRDWSGYDLLALDIYNSSHKQAKFSLCINDKGGGGYWDQLNHYTTLAPGWNHLQFSVNRYVGERGAVRIRRYLNLKNIQKFWCRVDTADKEQQFFIDNIRLLSSLKIVPPSRNFLLFDFVKDDFRTARGFTGIESRHNYTYDVGFGFVDADIWRSHDSLYADTLFRDGIFINKGQFRVDVPNGKYMVYLVPNALGEWFEHFWTKRKITIQGEVVLQEKRDSVQDYLKDFLRFSNIEPQPEDNAYDLYLKPLFAPIEVEVTVDDGKIIIDCAGDDSAIMLNALIIYPATEKERGKQFITQLEEVRRQEFNTICRRVKSEPQLDPDAISAQDRKRGYYTALIESDTQLRYNQVIKTLAKNISLRGGRGQRPVQALMVRNLKERNTLQLKISPLKSAEGNELKPQPEWLRYGVNQFQSRNGNHETYELAPRFLRRFPVSGLSLEKDFSRLIWLQIPLKAGTPAGEYRGQLDITLHGQKRSYPVTLQVEDFDLPEVDIAVGFLGLDPVSCDYLHLFDVTKFKRKNRLLMLQALRERGFSTWSSLPPASFAKEGSSWRLQGDEVDILMKEARKLGFNKKVFTYGGSFPVVLNKKGKIDGVAESEYRSKTAEILRKHMEKNHWLPVVFDITDEATGYAQTVKRDLQRVTMVKEFYPFLQRGGYSHPIERGEPGYKLNEELTDISFSSITPQVAARYQRENKRWGMYNQALDLFQSNRKSFGEDLIKARKMGCDHLLGWHLTLAQNYPYYDLDGRENDAMMVFPRLDGGFDYALKFEWAALGLEEYRLMMYRNAQKRVSIEK